MLSVHSFTFNIFAENTYLLYDQTGECIIIDPGCDTESEKQKLIDSESREDTDYTCPFRSFDGGTLS